MIILNLYWCCFNKLSINPSKSEYILITIFQYRFSYFDFEKLKHCTRPQSENKILAIVLLLCMGLIISIDTRPSPKYMYVFLFLAPLIVLHYDFENINRQLTLSEFVLLYNDVWE